MTSSYVRREAIAQEFPPDMDMECGDQAPQNGVKMDPVELKHRLQGHGEYPRAPSPGMDTYADMTDLDYGYVNGYGDTAESMPDETGSGYGYVKSNNRGSYEWQGLKNKGWH